MHTMGVPDPHSDGPKKWKKSRTFTMPTDPTSELPAVEVQSLQYGVTGAFQRLARGGATGYARSSSSYAILAWWHRACP